MKIFKVLLETVLPITIVTLFPVGYFFITDRIFPEPELNNCESCHTSTIVYITYTLLIVTLSSLYQLMLGNRILKKNENSFILSIGNCIVFAIFFTGILALINVFQVERKIEWDFIFAGFIVLFLFGLMFTLSTKICQKIFKDRITVTEKRIAT